MLLLQLPFLGQLLVQILLKDAKYVGDSAHLDALVYKIKSLAVNRQDSNEPPLEHPVEIAGPRLHRFFGRDGELLTLRLLGGRLCFGRGMDRAGKQGACEGHTNDEGRPGAD
jgi:hypothetical protein